ncbi:MAG TPA: hypothetical protein VN838_08715 [Bradyrhizobium sp.]|nr:hypothetical protein [Bradyrhizobium sp.]
MNIKASGRSALIIAAGFWVCVSGPLQAAEDADGGVAAYRTEAAAGPPVALNKFTKRSRHWKHVSSQRKSVKAASRDSTESAKTSEKKISEKRKTLEAAAALNDDSSALPPSVANANAQLVSADAPADSATALSSQARDRLQVMAANQSDPQTQSPAANTELVAADELNDVDRALSENSDEKDKAPAATLAMVVAQTPAQPQAAAVSNDDSAWGQTSLIGKIFIAFGGLLTLASAARMFMA